LPCSSAPLANLFPFPFSLLFLSPLCSFTFHSFRSHSFILLSPHTSIDQRPHSCFSHSAQTTLLLRHTVLPLSRYIHSRTLSFSPPPPTSTTTTYSNNQQVNKAETQIWNTEHHGDHGAQRRRSIKKKIEG
jgi:hypothetical protein